MHTQTNYSKFEPRREGTPAERFVWWVKTSTLGVIVLLSLGTGLSVINFVFKSLYQ